eukprot:GHVR01156043.1.p1 GENE.GHVR01156043.1~~GHVR01156043.1.p1  ORF type:complete len:283 (+),score=20.59 GHVR01156043.1:272-1120(+)
MITCLSYIVGKFPAMLYASAISREKVGWTLFGVFTFAVVFTLLVAPLSSFNNFSVCMCVVFTSFFLSPIFPLLIRYLEGRRTTELQLAVFSLSYTVSPGVCRSVGRLVLNSGVPVSHMPALLAIIAGVIFAVSIFFLHKTPKPNLEDVSQRSARHPITLKEQATFWWDWGFGLVPLVIVYVLIVTLRMFRDYFAPELWSELLEVDVGNVDTSLFTITELCTGLVTLIILSGMIKVKNNWVAFKLLFGVMCSGYIHTHHTHRNEYILYICILAHIHIHPCVFL